MELEDKVKEAAVGLARTFGPLAAEFMEAMESYDWRRAEELSIKIGKTMSSVQYATSIMKQGQE